MGPGPEDLEDWDQRSQDSAKNVWRTAENQARAGDVDKPRRVQQRWNPTRTLPRWAVCCRTQQPIKLDRGLGLPGWLRNMGGWEATPPCC